MSMLAIITARGGSKGIPCKNLRRVGNRTLTQIAVDTAIQLKDDGIVEVYGINIDGEEIFLNKTEISQMYLTDSDIENLKDGVVVYGIKELNQVLEDFE